MPRDYMSILDAYLFPKGFKNNLWKCCYNTDKLVYVRLGCFIYLLCVYLWALAFMPNAIENFIYLTMQGYFLAWVYFALALEDYITRRVVKQEVIPGLWKLTYLVYEVAITIEVSITLVFWIFLMPIVLKTPGVSANTIAVNVNLHAGPLICLVIDLVMNCIEFPRRHFYVTLVFGVLYMLINMLWTLLNNVIYQPIDWVSLSSYLLVMGCFLLTYLTHYLCGLYYTKVKKEKQTSLEHSQLNSHSYMHDQI